MSTKLKDIVITKVALCNEGACSAAHVMLYKKKPEGGSTTMNLDAILKEMKPEHRAIVEAEIKKAMEVIPEATVTELTKSKEDLAKSIEDLKAANKKADDAKASGSKEDDTEEELLKSVDPAVRILIEKAKAREAAANAVLTKMKDEADTAKAVALAKSLAFIPGKEEEMTTLFKSLGSKDAELCKTVHELFKSVAEVMKTSEVFTEVGKSTATQGDGDSWAKIEKAAGVLAKSENITLAKATARVLEDNPDLYEGYVKEQIG